MLSKADLMGLLVGFAWAHDIDVLAQDSFLGTDICARADREIIRRMAYLVNELYRDFDYIHSPEFNERAKRQIARCCRDEDSPSK